MCCSINVFKGLTMHSDELLKYVLWQIEEDLHNGNVEGVMDLLEHVPREALIAYLGNYVASLAIQSGAIKPEEVEDDMFLF